MLTLPVRHAGTEDTTEGSYDKGSDPDDSDDYGDDDNSPQEQIDGSDSGEQSGSLLPSTCTMRQASATKQCLPDSPCCHVTLTADDSFDDDEEETEAEEYSEADSADEVLEGKCQHSQQTTHIGRPNTMPITPNTTDFPCLIALQEHEEPHASTSRFKATSCWSPPTPASTKTPQCLDSGS